MIVSFSLAIFSLVALAQKQAVIEVEKNNFFYEGIANPISIAVPGILSDALSVSVKGGSISKIDPIKYLFTPNIGAMQAEISIISISEKDTVYYGTQVFRIKSIPEPNLFFAGKTVVGDKVNIQKAMFRANPTIGFKFTDFEFEIKPPVVVSAEYSYIKNGKNVSSSFTGSRFPDAAVAEIVNLPAGSEIIVSDIKASHNGLVRMYSSFVFSFE